MRKLRCVLGIHEWYIDAALVHSVRRCNYCDATEGDVEALDRERERYMRPDLRPKDIRPYIENPDVLSGKVMYPTMIPNPALEEPVPPAE